MNQQARYRFCCTWTTDDIKIGNHEDYDFEVHHKFDAEYLHDNDCEAGLKKAKQYIEERFETSKAAEPWGNIIIEVYDKRFREYFELEDPKNEYNRCKSDGCWS